MSEDTRINAMIAALFCDREIEEGRYDLSTPRIIDLFVYATDGRRAVKFEVDIVCLNMFSERQIENTAKFPGIARAFCEKRLEFESGKWQKLANVREPRIYDESCMSDGVLCQVFDGVPIQDRFVLPLYFARDCEFRALSDMVLFRWPGCQAMIMRYGQ